MPRRDATTLTLDDEKRLLKRLHRGDRDAFRELYDAFATRLYRVVILPRIGVEDIAEDILRDTFLTAFNKVGQVHWQNRSLFNWLSRIAYNKVMDVHRANRRTERFVQGFSAFIELARPGPADPETQALAQEEVLIAKDRVHALIEALNPRYRQAVELRFFEQRSREDCAEAMAVTVGNFDVILFRAIKRMKTLYQRRYRDEET